MIRCIILVLCLILNGLYLFFNIGKAVHFIWDILNRQLLYLVEVYTCHVFPVGIFSSSVA